jgi:uncharacterized membrane protein (UPF0182 family)
VFGPEQIQARINQDDRVSQQVTLWDQSNSEVIYGNLLVIPVEDSLLYAQPLFLRSASSDIPELRRTVLVFGDQLVMEPTLEDALLALFGDAAPETLPPPGADVLEDPATPEGQDPSDPLPVDPQRVDPRVADLIGEAAEAFSAANEALQDGDLAGYAENTERAQEAVRQAEALLTGEPVSTDGATPSPDATPGVGVTPDTPTPTPTP